MLFLLILLIFLLLETVLLKVFRRRKISKIGYNGKTRTAALNTDAFTRIRENIQYYFVPFQSLWKYFEQQVNNMTNGDAGQNISKFASSSTVASHVSTSLPYISYIDLSLWLDVMYKHALSAVDIYISSNQSVSSRSAAGFQAFCASSSNYSDVFICDGYRLCRAAKLLMSLGYGNFSTVIQYDIYAQAEKFLASGDSWSISSFQSSNQSLTLGKFESSSLNI